MPMVKIDAIEPRHDADEAANQRGTGENLRFNGTSSRRLGPQFAPHSVFCTLHPGSLGFLLSEFTGMSTRFSLCRLHAGLSSVTLRHGRAALSQVGAG